MEINTMDIAHTSGLDSARISTNNVISRCFEE